MSTITRERAELKAFITGFLTDPAHDNQSSRSLTTEVFRIALASLEAEPVACPKCNDTGMADSGGVQPWGEPISVPCDCTAPPVSVSEREPAQMFGIGSVFKPQILSGNEVDCVNCAHYQPNVCHGEGCPAAMLQGADGNSPVIQDGWVMVPKEPTPDMREAYHQAQAEYEDVDGLWSPDHQWQAMLAAAPHFREIWNSSTNNFRENAETSTNCPCCGRKPLKNKTCSVAGCDGKHVARGLCVKHYAIERKKDPSRRESIRAADKRYRARKSAALQQEVK